MKRNKFFMLGIVTVLVAVLSLTFVSNTFAKYTSTVTGSDSARVAEWSWAFNGNASGTEEGTATWDLFHANAYELNVEGRVQDGVDDADVVNDRAGETLIAPGTGGYSYFTVTNNSEVDGTYTIDFEADEDGVPLQWSIDNTTWVDSIDNLDVNTPVEVEHGQTSATIKVYWRWAFDDTTPGKLPAQTDENDTDLGQAGSASPEVNVTVVFTQVD